MAFVLFIAGLFVFTIAHASHNSNEALEPPCDLFKLGAYCTEPGRHYPYDIIRNFIGDNFGTMRRMFGSSAPPSTDSSVPGARNMPLAAAFAEHDEKVQQSSRAMDSSFPDERRLKMPSIADLSRRRRPPNQSSTYNPCHAREAVEKPFWVRNEQGQLRVVVNEDPWDQYIQTEQCADQDVSGMPPSSMMMHRNTMATLSDRQLEVSTGSSNITERLMPGNGMANNHKQSACGPGCGCFQEQRLVKLLVADPNKKEMGIFVDWISVPACCICKCMMM